MTRISLSSRFLFTAVGTISTPTPSNPSFQLSKPLRPLPITPLFVRRQKKQLWGRYRRRKIDNFRNPTVNSAWNFSPEVWDERIQLREWVREIERSRRWKTLTPFEKKVFWEFGNFLKFSLAPDLMVGFFSCVLWLRVHGTNICTQRWDDEGWKGGV